MSPVADPSEPAPGEGGRVREAGTQAGRPRVHPFLGGGGGSDDVGAQPTELEPRQQPQSTAADFRLLFDDVAVWWAAETARLQEQADQGMEEGQLRAARLALLDREVGALQKIARLRHAAAQPGKKQRVDAQLRALEAPRVWELPGGGTLEVETPGTQKAAALAAAYRGLVAAGAASTDDRLRALLAAKHLAKEVDCPLTREIVALVDREADLIGRRDRSCRRRGPARA